jgi:hypothetical protein
MFFQAVYEPPDLRRTPGTRQDEHIGCRQAPMDHWTQPPSKR